MRVDRGVALTYGVLGLPLAFAALPIYVHVPKLYADGFGLSLTWVGGVLLAVRILDALLDPLIGWASDRFAARRAWILASLPLLGFGLVGLLAPPVGAGAGWLAVFVVVVTLGYSLASINYHAWGAELGDTPDERTRLVASREGFALVGVVLAAALPSVLGGNEVVGLALLGGAFPVLLALGAGCTLVFAPGGRRMQDSGASVWGALRAAISHRPFARLLGVFAANGIAAAIPSATVLFFIADVLRAEAQAGLFLVLYFAAGAASMPLWVFLARRLGKLHAWLAGMLLASLVFVWASTLGEGDVAVFALICVLSGIALGADLALPPAMLADLLARDAGLGAPRAGAWFGCWNFVAKANLALAAGIALPLLETLGYAPGTRDVAGLGALAAVYALLPVALKALAAFLLWRCREAFEGEGEVQCANCLSR